MPSPENAVPSEWKSTRFWLAIGVTIVSITAVTILARIIITKGNGTEAQNVLNSVLPLLGTWVGTILAYYFSKENFEAATRSVTELAKQITPQEKLRATLAREKMIPKDQIFYKSLPADKVTLVSVLSDLEEAKKGNRVPILGDKSEPKYILHRSIIDKFLAACARSANPPGNLNALTLENLLDQAAEIKHMAESFGVVRSDATLADALAAMSSTPDCQDVFVTKTGSRDEPILGWITNVVIQENSKV